MIINIANVKKNKWEDEKLRRKGERKGKKEKQEQIMV